MICSLLERNKSLKSTSSKGNEDAGNERHSYTCKRQTQFVSISYATERCCIGSCQTSSVAYFYISGAGSSHGKLITSNNNLSWVIDSWIWKVTSCRLQMTSSEKPAMTSTLLWHCTYEWGKGDSDPSGQQPPWFHCLSWKDRNNRIAKRDCKESIRVEYYIRLGFICLHGAFDSK